MLRVLIVDDEPNLCANLCAYLEDEGMDVASAISGEEAVNHLGSGAEVDVIVTDMRLPGMDGNDTIRAIHAAHPSVKFVIHTGTAVYSIPSDLQEIGVTERCVFKKPLADMAGLAAALVELVHSERGDTDG